ncbi:MAG: VOC family protein [Anaerolineae bacterium]|nr:VOC family protein [Anaerolineae bacterium]
MKRFNSICIVTGNVRGLRDFYQRVLQMAAEGDEIFATFSTPGANLTLFSVQGMEGMAPGSMSGSGAGNCVLEFQVQDVDEEYERLRALDVEVVKPPTTQPWGLRSVWFRDPDGNIVNFYAHVAGG